MLRGRGDGTRLATGGQDDQAAIWDAASGKRLLSLEAPNASLTFSPDGKRIATWDRTPAVKVWDAQTGKSLLGLPASDKPFFASVVFSPDGRYLASLVHSDIKDPLGVVVWDARTGKRTAALQGAESLNCLAYAADGKRLVTGGDKGSTTVWELASGKVALTVKPNLWPVTSAALSRDGRWLATTAGRGGVVRVLALPSGRVSWEARDYKVFAMRVAFSHGGRRLAAAGLNAWPGEKTSPSGYVGREGEVVIRDTSTGELLGRFSFGQGEAAYDLDWSLDGSRLATAHGDGTVKVWLTKELLSR